MMPDGRRPSGHPEGGVALILVLLVLALLLTVAGQLAQAMRIEATTTLNFRDSLTATYLAEAAYHRAVAEILPEALAHHPDEQGLLVFRRARGELVQVPSREDISLGRGRLSYRISDEEARLHLNRATPDVLQRLLTELGVERQARDVVVDSVQDWRDQNEEYRLNGAESDYYLSLPVPYRSKNADFDSVEELLQVKGVTPEMFRGRPETPGLGEYLTVAGVGAINVNTVSPVVLRALRFAQAEADLLIAGRPYLDLAGLSPTLRRGTQRVRSETFRIEATGEVPGQGKRTLVAVVQRRAGRDGVVRVTPLQWRWDPEPTSP
jgi:general secretion pathway protein K